MGQAKLRGKRDSRGMRGIEAAFAAHCSTCNHNTWTIRGAPDAVADLHMAMDSEMRHEIKTGVATASKALR